MSGLQAQLHGRIRKLHADSGLSVDAFEALVSPHRPGQSRYLRLILTGTACSLRKQVYAPLLAALVAKLNVNGTWLLTGEGHPYQGVATTDSTDSTTFTMRNAGPAKLSVRLPSAPQADAIIRRLDDVLLLMGRQAAAINELRTDIWRLRREVAQLDGRAQASAPTHANAAPEASSAALSGSREASGPAPHPTTQDVTP